MMRRKLALSLVSLALLFGCTRPDQLPENASGGGAPVTGDWAIVRYEAEPDTLNPSTYHTAYSQYAWGGANNSQIYEYLLQYNRKTWALDQPLLAEAYPEISDDHLTYTYKIREGVKWHDGRPLTPEDVVFTHKATMAPFVDSGDKRGYFADLTDVELLDGRRVRFTFNKPNVLNIINTSSQQAIIPKHVFDPDGVLDTYTYKDIVAAKAKADPKLKEFGERFNKHTNNRMPVGTGPYKFEKWETGKEIVLTRNEDYWGQKPYLEKIVIRIIPDFPAALTALKAGEIDFNPVLLPIQYAQQTSGPGFDDQFVKSKYIIPQYYFIGWNEERPFFKDKRVRQAMTMLVNREQIIESLRFGLAKIASSHFIPGAFNHNPNLKPLPYDPKRAGELLDEAGWKDNNGDGIRDKDGIPFRIEFIGSSSSTFTKQLIAVLKDEFGKAGIDVRERLMEFNVFLSTVLDHKYDFAANAWVSPIESDPYQIFHSSQVANRGSNWVGFKNAESDRLIEQARLEFDPEKRKQILWKWQELIHEEQPYTFLFYVETPTAYHKRFQNVEWAANRPGYVLTEWFVPKQVQKYLAVSTP